MADAPPVHDAAELTRYIETRYHARHRVQLASLVAMAEKVEMVHFGDEAVPEGGAPGIENPIAVMRADHDDHGRAIAQISHLTGNLSLPAGACGTWTRLYDGLIEFVEDLTEHMRLENEVLFPQFETHNHANA